MPATIAHAQPASAPAVPDAGELLLARIPILTVGMIIALLFVFGLEQRFAVDSDGKGGLGITSLRAFGAAGYDLVVQKGDTWRFLLAPFLHASTSHLIGNAVALFFVGYKLEPVLGRAWLAGIFILSALGGMVGSLAGNPHTIVTVGASGAISGLIAALFVVSFSHRSGEDQGAMRMVALRFGLPALAPLAFGATGHTDYYAHGGGALTGAGVALALCCVWRAEAFRPPFTRFATILCLTSLAAAAAASMFIVQDYPANVALAAKRVPADVRTKDFNRVSYAQSAELVRRYPDDPFSHMALAAALIRANRLGDGEAELRRTIAMSTIAMSTIAMSNDAQDRVVHDVALAVLATILMVDGRSNEAAAITHTLCNDPASVGRTVLVQVKLCR